MKKPNKIKKVKAIITWVILYRKDNSVYGFVPKRPKPGSLPNSRFLKFIKVKIQI